MSGVFVLPVLAALTALSSWAQGVGSSPGHSQQVKSPPAIQLEDIERRIGPLAVSGEVFTVILRSKRVVSPTPTIDPAFRQTLVQLEIQDTGGTVHYSESFPFEISGSFFSETMDAGARLLKGSEGSGILVSYTILPSTPLGGSSWQVFGLFNKRLVPFSQPIAMEGELIEAGDSTEVVNTVTEPNLVGDVLNFRVWTGNLFVIVPLRVDWVQAVIRPAWRCGKMTVHGLKPLCRFRVEARRVSPAPGMTFIRLHPDADEESGIAQHVVVTPDSEVEFLEAEAELIWDEGSNGIGVSVSDDVWLKVRVDGKEGWIHTQEDFLAIGLPQAG